MFELQQCVHLGPDLVSKSGFLAQDVENSKIDVTFALDDGQPGRHTSEL